MDRYTHGHHRSVIAHHGSRTAADSAAFLLPRLRPGMSLLDVGCGPGSITVDLARRVAPGRVVGVDMVDDVLKVARETVAESGLTNLEIQKGSIYELPFEDATFDVVFAHQVLQHLVDPVAAVREMRRVGALVAARDVDYATFAWHPPHPKLTRWLALYHQVTKHNGAQADAGRYLLSWFREAGFEDVRISTSSWSYGDVPGRAFWGDGWIDRATQSAFAKQAIEYGFSNIDELHQIADAWGWWRDQPDGYLAMIHTEALAVST